MKGELRWFVDSVGGSKCCCWAEIHEAKMGESGWSWRCSEREKKESVVGGVDFNAWDRGASFGSVAA